VRQDAWPEAVEATTPDSTSSSAVGKVADCQGQANRYASEGSVVPTRNVDISMAKSPPRLAGNSELGLRDLVTQLERQLADEERSRSTVDFELKRRVDEENSLRDELAAVRLRCAKASSGLAAARQRAADAEMQMNLRGMRTQAEELRAENFKLRKRLRAQGLEMPPPVSVAALASESTTSS